MSLHTPPLRSLCCAPRYVCVGVFTLEYVARIYAAGADPEYKSRWAFVVSFFAVVDFLAIAPFYVSLAGATTCVGCVWLLRCLAPFVAMIWLGIPILLSDWF